MKGKVSAAALQQVPDVPPRHLSPESKAWFATIARNFELDDVSRKLLAAAATCLDRATEAREMLRKEGLTFTDRLGNPRRHPASAVERDAQLTLMKILKSLGLPESAEPEPPPKMPLLALRPHRKKETPR